MNRLNPIWIPIIATIIIGALISIYWVKYLKNETTISPIATYNAQITCKDEPEGTPVITSMSKNDGPVGTALDIKGCNFSGFEGDKTVWIENNKGIKGIIYGERTSTSKLLRIVIKERLCQKDTSYSGMECDAYLELTPGVYKIYVLPFGKKSNEVNFTIK